MVERDLRALHSTICGGDPYTLLAHGIDDLVLDTILPDGMTLRALRGPVITQALSLLPLLTDVDVKQRIAAAQLFALLPEVADARVALAAAVSSETDQLARYNQLFALIMHGTRVDVPEARGKEPLITVLARFVRAMNDGTPDGECIHAARTITKLVPTPAFPGGGSPYQAVSAALVGAQYKRKDAQGLAELALAGNRERIIADAFGAVWPFARTPTEPAVEVASEIREWLRPLLEPALGTLGGLPFTILSRHGFIPGRPTSHLARVFTGAREASDVAINNGPAWLLARRVVDGRAAAETWLDAMAKLSPADVLATARDLVTMCIPEPWPPPRLPYTSTPTIDAYVRYFTLLRPTLAALPTKALEAFLDEPGIDGHHAAALAALVERGIELPPSRDAGIAAALSYLNEYDVESLRLVVQSLAPERRAAVLANVEPRYTADAVHGGAKLTHLWYFADLLTGPLVQKLVDQLHWIAINDALLTPKTPHHEALGAALRTEVEAAFGSLGARAIPGLRAAKPKAVARPIFELALTAAAASPSTSAYTNKQKKAPTKKK